jgi:hypothetical protein
MAEQTVLELARRLRDGRDWRDLRGICFAAPQPPADAVLLPSYAAVSAPPSPATSTVNTTCPSEKSFPVPAQR